jgi:formylglycine-generating enzyme required for sulfatase activity/serine/threonine protein kinase
VFRENDKIGPYTLKKKLGRGAFGVVWLAEKQTMAGSFQFALKLAAREDIDLKALQEEVATWRTASGHPNVLPLIEADIHEDDYVIVSEYAPDGSLEKWLGDNGGRAPSVDAAVDMIIGILKGLEHLHSRKIIHRDLKPANILLQGNTPRLADFGLARVLKSTQSATITGTVPYMSPDALKGARTVETDIWSVGVIFYQLLTGQMPYPQKEQVNLMYAILNDEHQPLSDSIPKPLCEIIERALKKNPDERYQSAKEMREVLRATRRAKPEPVIEPKKTTPQPKVEDEKKTEKLPKVEDENKTLKMMPQHPTLPSPQVDDEKTITRKPKLLIDTILAPQPQPFQPNVVPFAPQMPKKNIGIWLGVGGVGLLAVVILLCAFVPSVFKNVLNSNNPATNTPQTTNTGDKTHTANLPNGVKPEMVLIPAGSFMMGSSDEEVQAAFEEAKRSYSSASLDWFTREKPKHRVTISKPFYMGKFEVTQAQWQAVMGTNPSYFKNCDQCPVENVSWNDAQEFIRKLNALNDGHTYRLPSEAEWEYACRAGTTTAFSFGDSLSSTQANFDGNYPYGNASKGEYKRKTVPVGSYQPNAFGLYDMHGNVWEWCEDVYADSYEGLPTGGSANMSKGDSGYRVLRGGSWGVSGWGLRSAVRLRVSAVVRNNNIGFRVVASARTQ